MLIHDWTRVDAGIFHDFHQSWMPAIKHALNGGRLPADYYALVEQVAGGRWPDVLTLQGPVAYHPASPDTAGGLLLAETPPQVRYRFKAEGDLYAAKASAVVVRHVSGHHVVAVLEVVSPGNKHSRSALQQFIGKAVEMLRAGIHLVVVDLLPPGPRDPQGLHKAIWDEFLDNDFALPNDKRLTLASYAAGDLPEAFIEPVAVGSRLPDMPLFLSPETYVPVPLESTYASAWETMPAYWREVIEGRRESNG
ncbi:MAG TPA: DUF4058 family protein [Pirellulales bacterium]|nr:DUF4058 family protein [Pirellulales bacterium]